MGSKLWLTARTWPTWALAKSCSWLQAVALSSSTPPPPTGAFPAQGPSGTLALEAAPELEIIKEEVGNLSVGWQGFALS